MNGVGLRKAVRSIAPMMVGFVLGMVPREGSAALTGDEPGLRMLLHLDEQNREEVGLTGIGSREIPLGDATGACHGFLQNNFGYNDGKASVYGGYPSSQGFAYGTFGNSDSYIAITNLSAVVGKNPFRDGDWSFVCYVRDLNVKQTIPHLLARAVEIRDGQIIPAGGDVAWQVHFDKNLKPHVRTHSMGGISTDAVGDAAVSVEAGVWYQVAVVVTRNPSPDSDINHTTMTFNIRWTKAAADAVVGEPILAMTTPAWLSPNSQALMIGAGKDGSRNIAETGVWAEKGFLGGYLDEVSYWSRALTVEELTAQVRDFNRLCLRWKMNETGATPVAADATGKGRRGISFGNVTGGVESRISEMRRGSTAYTGFTSAESFVAITNLTGTDTGMRDKPFTLILWAQNPQLSSTPALLARSAWKEYGAKTTDTDNKVPWQLMVMEDGSLKMTVMGENGSSFANAAVRTAPLEWKRGRWYQIALSYVPTNAEGKHAFTLWRTEGGAVTLSESLLHWSLEREQGQGYNLAKGDALVIGGGPASKNTSYAPAGFWGGDIDDVIFVQGENATQTQIEANLALYQPCGLLIRIR